MTNAIYDQFLSSVKDTLDGLTLSGMDSNEIVIRKVPWDGQMVHRGITVSPDAERIDESGSTNERDKVGYPAVVVMCFGTSRGWAENLATFTAHRQAIRRAFHNQRITGVSATNVSRIICTVTNEGLFIPKRYLANLDVSQLTIWGWYMEPRT